jgi:hypothetical protein
VVACLDLNLNQIFSPADADLFHANFTISFEFLTKFEQKCSVYDKDIKKKLLASQTYKFFVKKWPIQVYFQIRFQEIVSKFEEDLISYRKLSAENLHENANDNDDDGELDDRNQNVFYLNVTETLVKQMEVCWTESKCFLKCLLSQFWKLNLQLISRYCLFFIQLFQQKLNDAAAIAAATSQTTTSASQSDGTVASLEQRAGDVTSSIQSLNQKSSADDLSLCVILINDADKLCRLKVFAGFSIKQDRLKFYF